MDEIKEIVKKWEREAKKGEGFDELMEKVRELIRTKKKQLNDEYKEKLFEAEVIGFFEGIWGGELWTKSNK